MKSHNKITKTKTEIKKNIENIKQDSRWCFSLWIVIWHIWEYYVALYEACVEVFHIYIDCV